METLTHHDLQFALLRCPRALVAKMKNPKWAGRVFVGGGFLRSIVSREEINDVDVFVGSKDDAETLAQEITGLNKWDWRDAEKKREAGIIVTDNAITLTAKEPHIQIIHRWVFKQGKDVADSFDFTCCCAAFWFNLQDHSQPGWQSYCDARFYPDVAAKRLIYRSPIRNEDAGGSALRLLKYYRKGYCAPIDSFAAVIARLVAGVDHLSTWDLTIDDKLDEKRLTKVLTGLLREVDPAIDPTHVAHLPAEDAAKAELEIVV